MKLKARSLGFTLIELLIVLLIVSVVLSMITVSFYDGKRQRIDQELLSLKRQLNRLRFDALYESSSVKITFSENSYIIKNWSAQVGDWIAESTDGKEGYWLPEDIIMSVKFDINDGQSYTAQSGVDQNQSVGLLILSAEGGVPSVVTLRSISMDYERSIVFDGINEFVVR
ncbi:MAG: prepilin-type N-terminal cleavage/methylation domain-containing protein [Pseudomonadales bacterium]